MISILTASPVCERGAYLLHVYTYRICFVRYFTKYKSIFVTCLKFCLSDIALNDDREIGEKATKQYAAENDSQ